MANNDLVLQKMLRVTPQTHARVRVMVGKLQTRGIKGSQEAAVRALLDGWEELERISKSDDIVIITSENIVDRGQVVTDFLEQHFGGEKLEL